MSRFTEALKKVVKEKLQAKTNVAGVDLNFDDKGTLSAKGKIGSTDVSANSKGDLYAKGDFGGGTMATAVNKDGDGGVAFTNRKGRTASQTAGDRDAWVSAGPNQISKRVQMNDINEEEVQYDAHGFATVHRDGKFYLIFNDEVVGKYDTMQELKDAHEHVINKIKLPEELEEGTGTEWEIIINGNSYTTAVGKTQEEAITNFWKANVEKEGIERFLGDMLYAQELKTNESVTESLDEEMEAMLRIAGLR